MNKEYLFSLFKECNQDLDIYDKFNWQDYRGFVEFVVEEPRIMSAMQKIILAHGWVFEHFTDPRRLIVGKQFDIPGDDFEGLRIVISIQRLNEWAKRYIGRVRKPEPQLTDVLNEYITGRKTIDDVLVAEAVYIQGRR